MCEEMVKLRKELDARGIKWEDASTTPKSDPELRLDRTHFRYKGKSYSVINGYGSYGGYMQSTSDNRGLLELMVDHNEPKGWLTSDAVLEIMGLS